MRLPAFYSRCHGVSGVGGSNPLVPTKNPNKTNPCGWFFYACFLNGELLGKKAIKCCTRPLAARE
nr:hypothetical protein F0329_17300 [Citrobacter werkmanii]